MRLTEVLLSSVLVSILLETPVYAQRKKCPRIGLANGRVKLRARGKMAYFKCKKRYTRIGDKFAVCLQAGTWSHPPPLCISRGCRDLGTQPNMDITESYNGAMLKFECPIGTKRNGPETITCDGRNWSDEAPFCEAGLTLGCDFEKEGLCGWSQDETDNFDWTRKSGQTPTMSTGPPGDHTTGSGFYMFIESSNPRKAGDVARLISPAYPPTLKNLCFSFWYHMQGPAEENAVGSLEVFIKPDTAYLADIDPEFYMDGNQGPDWQHGLVIIPNQDENFKIIIVGTRKDAFVSDIAIDDLRIFNCSEVVIGARSIWKRGPSGPRFQIDLDATTETTTAIPSTTPSTQPMNNMTLNVTEATSDNNTTSAFRTKMTTKSVPAQNVTHPPVRSTDVTTYQPTTTSVTISPTSTLRTTQRTTAATTLQTTPITKPRKTRPTTSVTTTLPSKPKTRTTKMPNKTETVTPVMTSNVTMPLKTHRVTETTTTAKASSSTSAPHQAITTVYTFSNLATDVTEISTSHSPEPTKEVSTYVSQDQIITSTQSDSNVTSSSTLGNEIKTPPTYSTRSSYSTTDLSNIIPTVIVDLGNSRDNDGGASSNIMPLVIGITAGIVVGMIVIGLLAWLWARNQRKKKELEAAEDEMYMITGDGTYNYK